MSSPVTLGKVSFKTTYNGMYQGKLASMASSRGKNKSYFATFVERKSSLHIVLKISDRVSPSMQKAIEYLCSVLPLTS